MTGLLRYVNTGWCLNRLPAIHLCLARRGLLRGLRLGVPHVGMGGQQYTAGWWVTRSGVDCLGVKLLFSKERLDWGEGAMACSQFGSSHGDLHLSAMPRFQLCAKQPSEGLYAS